MLRYEINVNGVYMMKVSGVLRKVRVDRIEKQRTSLTKQRTVYLCTNLETGKPCCAKSASKFRYVAEK